MKWFFRETAGAVGTVLIAWLLFGPRTLRELGWLAAAYPFVWLAFWFVDWLSLRLKRAIRFPSIRRPNWLNGVRRDS